ncbi:unnamed protein product [Closterium sp. NIES-54]
MPPKKDLHNIKLSSLYAPPFPTLPPRATPTPHPHISQVLDRLCNAFRCGIDELQYKGDIGRHAKLMDARKLELHGFDYSPNVVAVYSGKFFDRLWRSDPQINQCVHDAFSCTSLWCIRSKVLSLLIGNGPKPGMQEVVDRDLRVVPPLVLRGEGVGRKEGEEKGGTMDPQMVQKGEGLRLQFDVALHIRGHAVNVEGDYCISKDKKCQEKAQKGEQVRAHAYMKPRQWRCIARLMQFLRVKKAAAGGFTNATAAAGRPPNATTAAGGFNNATAAADGSANATAAADGSANATGDNFGIFDGKASHASANAANKTSKASTEHTRLSEYPQKSAIVGTKKEKRRNLQQRVRLQDEWTVDDSLLVASIVPPGEPSATHLGHLRIFVSTDTEVFLSQVVENLRPFGEVYFSVSPAVHLSKSGGDYLATLADFALLSKGAVLLSFTRYISTFAIFAGMLGNGTVIADPALEHTCRFDVEHMGDAPHAALPALPHALCPARRTAHCCLAHDLHAALLVLCPALRSACTLPCTGACAPPCPAANAPSCPAARASPCPAAPAPPYPAARAPPCTTLQHKTLSAEATSLGACEPGSTGVASVEALHTFTLDSRATRCLFCDCTTVTPLTTPVLVSLADPSGGPVLARASTVLPCPAAPSGSLTGFHLPSLSKNLVSNAVLQDQFVTVTTPGGELVAICQVGASGQLAASGQVGASDQLAASCLCRLLSHQTLLWHHRLGHPSLPCLRGMHSCLLCATPRSSLFLPTTAPLQTLHMDVWGPTRVHGQDQERYFLLVFYNYTRYTTVFPLRSKADARGVLIDWIIAVRCHLSAGFEQDLQLNLWPRVSVLETLPTLRWTGEVGDASAFWVWGALSLVRDTTTGKLSPCTLRCGLAPSGVSQVNPPPFVEPLEISSDTSGLAEGGDLAADDTAATRRSPHLETPPGFPRRPSLPPPQPVAVDSGAAMGDETGGADSRGAGPEVADSRGAESGGVGSGGAGFGGADTGDAASPSGGGVVGAPAGGSSVGQQQQSRARAGDARGTGAAGTQGARAGGAGGTGSAGARVARAGGTRAAGTGGARARGVGGIGAGGAGDAGAAGAGCARDGGAGGTEAAGARGTGAAGVGGTGAAGAGGAGAGGTGVSGVGGTRGTGGAGAAGGADSTGTAPQRPFFYPRPQSSLPTPDSALRQVLSLLSSAGLTPPLLCPPPDQSQPQLLPCSQLHAPSPYLAQTRSLAERHEPESRPASPVRPPPVLVTHPMAIRPSSTPQHVALPSPPASSLPDVLDPESDLARAASPTVTRLLATVVTDPSFESTVASALVTELVDFADIHRLDNVVSLVTESESVCPPSVGGELALGWDILEDRQFELECLVAILPRFASMLLCPEGDPKVVDIPTPRSYAESITGSPLAFKAHYVARGFSQRQGVDFFRNFSPTLKMTTLRVLLHVAAQRDYELHSLDFSTAFLEGNIHEEIWLRHPPGFTGSFPEDTQSSL